MKRNPYNFSAFLIAFASVRVGQVGKQLDALVMHTTGLLFYSKLDIGVCSFSHREDLHAKYLAGVAWWM